MNDTFRYLLMSIMDFHVLPDFKLMTDLQQRLEKNNITVVLSDTFKDDPKTALQNIKVWMYY